jgi:HAD superfamily phosphatase (TIGR01668 family)
MVINRRVKLLQPDLVLEGSVLQLTPALLQAYGLKGLILDVDDTLVPTWTRDVSPEVSQWLAELRDSTQLWLVSNNINEHRIQRIGEALDVPYLHSAAKPSRRKLRQALEAINLPAAEVGMVGDRLFTDIIAGNRLGMFTILVEPILNPAEVSSKGVLRSFEIWFSRLLGASIISAAD